MLPLDCGGNFQMTHPTMQCTKNLQPRKKPTLTTSKTTKYKIQKKNKLTAATLNKYMYRTENIEQQTSLSLVRTNNE